MLVKEFIFGTHIHNHIGGRALRAAGAQQKAVRRKAARIESIMSEKGQRGRSMKHTATECRAATRYYTAPTHA